MELEKLIKKETKEIDSKVQGFLKDWQTWIDKNIPSLSSYAQSFREAHSGGKNLRGVLVRLGYKIAKGKENPDILKVAAAYEIFHTSILAHDDIIDQSPIRRGKASLYKALGGGHHGISQAICLGDIGFFLATKIIAQANFPLDEKVKALDHFSKTNMDTALGEMLDVELPYLKTERKEVDVTLVMKLKTARYTISGPLQLGAILAGGSKELIEGLGKFGEDLGIAYQIQDDILGVFGEEKELGKSNKSDIEEGKNTFLIIEALKKADKNQLRQLKKYYGKGKIDNKGLTLIRKIFEDTKALDYAQDLALRYTDASKNSISGLIKDLKMNTLLQQFADYLTGRTK